MKFPMASLFADKKRFQPVNFNGRCNVTLKEVIQLSSVPKFDIEILDDLQRINTIIRL